MKNIIKTIVFIVILGGMLAFLSLVFEPKDNNKDYDTRSLGANGILGEPKNTIDVVILGDSLARSSISPLQLFNEYGIASYSLTKSGENLYEAYDFVHESMKNQNLKLVIIDSHILFWTIKMNDVLNNKLNNFLKVFKYHNRWKELNINDLTIINNKNYIYTDRYKGFMIKDKTNPVIDYKEKINNNKKEKISIYKMFYLNKILKECNDNGIKVLFVSTPSYKSWNYAEYNSMIEFTNARQIPYLDFNPNNLADINWQDETDDKGDHINYKGAYKVTSYIGKYLMENYNLTDHRSDDNYTKWHRLFNDYYIKIKSLEKSN